ncbi:MAG TPA: DUF1622 domain-containing protein [Oscillospiraceae bacterium]|nr:DUF1622 domain-containing protein [Oscillospiraceae bacterium]
MNLHALESFLTTILTLGSHLLEIFGAIIILSAAVKTFFYFLTTGRCDRSARLNFARYLVFGLDFKLAGEILRTVIVRSMSEVVILASVVALRFILNLILHWEIHQEQKDQASEE